MARSLKNTATVFGGYLYQNLVGLRFLSNWLASPSDFSWVTFESDTDVDAKGLDDVVAEKSDGTRLVWQVKFTVDADSESNAISWSWLLDHKRKGTSLLQKWASAVAKVERLSEAALITNRRPDREVDSVLDHATGRIDVNKIPEPIRVRIEEQLGSPTAADSFLSVFEFRHSQQGDVALERTVAARFVPAFTSQHGWLSLYRATIDWATRKNSPAPDGRITLGIVRGVIDQRRPEPLQQYFKIPSAYQPPDSEWSDRFRYRVENGTDKVIVLWGSPGQGKSTFLSYVCKLLEAQKMPFIRHHYFLDLQDRTDRMTLNTVGSSLMHQMEAQHSAHVGGLGTGPENLGSWIARCAEGYAANGKRFVVVIDGLDHVWRENDHNREPLNSVFEQLLPVPENTLLIIGTQRVSEDQLPKNFAHHVDTNNWEEIPRMSRSCVRDWLEQQLSANRFELSDREDEGLPEVAAALYRQSSGHPLVLTYVFERLARNHRVLTRRLVEDDTLKPDGDILRYYGVLWRELNFVAKDALHLIADAGFIWPLLGLEGCLGVPAGEFNPQIGHLFYATEAGLQPFHGSLLAYIRDLEEHSERIHGCLPKVISWLDVQAPEFLRWGWLWIYQDRAGQQENLLTLPSRDWAIESLVKGYPREQIGKILGRAEERAFRLGNYPLAITHRWLKIRLENGPQFQIDEYDRIEACAILRCEDDHRLRVFRSERVSADYASQAFLARQFIEADELNEAIECQERIRKSINDRIAAGASDYEWFEHAVPAFLETAALTRKYDTKRLLENVQRNKRTSKENFRAFLLVLARHQDLKLLMDFVSLPMRLELRIELELLCIRMAGHLRAEIHGWPAFARFKHHPIVECWRLLYDATHFRPQRFVFSADELDLKGRGLGDQKSMVELFHSWFFHSLARAIIAGGSVTGQTLPKFENRVWLNTVFERLLRFSGILAGLLSGRTRPRFDIGFNVFRDIDPPDGFEYYSDFHALQLALLQVSEDVYFLTAPLDNNLLCVPQEEWERVSSSPLFPKSEWIAGYAKSVGRYLDASCVQRFIQREVSDTESRILPFNDRCEAYVELCELAVLSNIDDEARPLLTKIYRGGILAYGWRKDPSMSNVLDAIAALAEVDVETARELTDNVTPFVLVINDMTEDDGVKPSSISRLILKVRPELFARFYAHWLSEAEWYYAELAYSYFVDETELGSPMADLAMSAVWESYAVSSLRARVRKGETEARQVLDRSAELFGTTVDQLGKESHRHDSKDESSVQIALKFSDYSPARLTHLLDDLDREIAYTARRGFINGWFAYWSEEGKGVDLLAALDSVFEQDVASYELSQLLDAAFELSFELEGKKKAYRWLTRAQIHRHGWEEYYHSTDEGDARFRTVAEHYLSEWNTFIQDTAKSRYRSASDSLVIPHARLVKYLAVVGETRLAAEVTRAMVEITISEFSDQPVRSPAWLDNTR